MSGGKEDVPLARSELFDLHEAPIELRVLVRPICIDYEIVRALGTNKHLQEMI
jgi:hypothetical protein